GKINHKSRSTRWKNPPIHLDVRPEGTIQERTFTESDNIPDNEEFNTRMGAEPGDEVTISFDANQTFPNAAEVKTHKGGISTRIFFQDNRTGSSTNTTQIGTNNAGTIFGKIKHMRDASLDGFRLTIQVKKPLLIKPVIQ
ncbi:MAG: hypothetical protein H0X62_14690, partial [Bacteroidetes bacterium]|nr:hypothetical protein [Bacteroidota bacterium]